MRYDRYKNRLKRIKKSVIPQQRLFIVDTEEQADEIIKKYGPIETLPDGKPSILTWRNVPIVEPIQLKMRCSYEVGKSAYGKSTGR